MPTDVVSFRSLTKTSFMFTLILSRSKRLDTYAGCVESRLAQVFSSLSDNGLTFAVDPEPAPMAIM